MGRRDDRRRRPGTRLELSDNGLSGTLPGSLGDLTLLEVLDLSRNRLSGALPATLGNLSNLRSLNLHRSWALTGPLPDGLRLLPSLTTLSALRTELCAPRDADFQTWLAGISSSVLTCPPETQSVIDLAVFYPPYILGRHNNADGTLSEETMTRKLLAGVDLRVEESNRAMRDSGVNARIALVHAGKLEDETSFRRHDDLLRVQQTDDNHWDEVHGLRDKYAADVVWLMFLSGGATFPHLEVSTAHASKAFFVAEYDSTQVFAHELGHVMTLLHDRYQYQGPTGNVVDDAYYFSYLFGYSNRAVFENRARGSSLWRTLMSYSHHCAAAGVTCPRLARFSNPERVHPDPGGHAMGIPDVEPSGRLWGPVDATRALNRTRYYVANFRPTPEIAASFGAPVYTAVEGGDAATVTVRLSAAPEREMRLPIQANGDGAIQADWSGVPGYLEFAAADTEKTFDVVAVADAQNEAGEAVKLSFPSLLPSGVRTASPATANDVGAVPAAVTVPGGSTTAAIVVPIRRDGIEESQETFTVGIAPGTGVPGWSEASASAGTATVTITDRTEAISLSAATVTVSEGEAAT